MGLLNRLENVKFDRNDGWMAATKYYYARAKWEDDIEKEEYFVHRALFVNEGHVLGAQKDTFEHLRHKKKRWESYNDDKNHEPYIENIEKGLINRGVEMYQALCCIGEKSWRHKSVAAQYLWESHYLEYKIDEKVIPPQELEQWVAYFDWFESIKRSGRKVTNAEIYNSWGPPSERTRNRNRYSAIQSEIQNVLSRYLPQLPLIKDAHREQNNLP